MNSQDEKMNEMRSDIASLQRDVRLLENMKRQYNMDNVIWVWDENKDRHIEIKLIDVIRLILRHLSIDLFYDGVVVRPSKPGDGD
jgi:hypothetical protein